MCHRQVKKPPATTSSQVDKGGPSNSGEDERAKRRAKTRMRKRQKQQRQRQQDQSGDFDQDDEQDDVDNDDDDDENDDDDDDDEENHDTDFTSKILLGDLGNLPSILKKPPSKFSQDSSEDCKPIWYNMFQEMK